MKRLLIKTILLLFPAARLKNLLLRILGMDISKCSKVGHIIYLGDKLTLSGGARLESFSYYGREVELQLSEGAKIGKLNVFQGCFKVVLASCATISNLSTIKNGGRNIIPASSKLTLGANSKLTSGHYLDLSCSISVGHNTVIGGRETQIWTHGFLHQKAGSERYIYLNGVTIGNGVYIASRVTINPGSVIQDDANILAASVIAGEVPKGVVFGSASKRIVLDLSSVEIDDVYEIDQFYKCNNPRILRKKRDE